MNFVIGRNGSGKSAALTALTVCLGGKANTTNRGTSLKSFIREGKDQAWVKVKIKNQGGGYQPEVYGDSITVERHFSRLGASGFKLRSANDKIISTKKADLEEILDFFALHLENPLNVLTQDMARQFLNESTPAQKYGFFIKGVQLEELDNDYKLLAESISQVTAMLDVKKEDSKALQQKMQTAQERLEMSQKQESMRQRKRHTRKKMVWSQVVAEEIALTDIEDKVRQIGAAIDEDAQQLEKISEEFEQAGRNVEEAELDIRDSEQKLVPIQDGILSVKEQFDKNKKEIREHHAEQRTIKAHIDAAKDAIAVQQQRIAEEKQRLEAIDGGGHTRKLGEISDAKQRLEQIKHQGEENLSERIPLQQKEQAAAERVKSAKSEEAAKAEEQQKNQDKLQQALTRKGSSASNHEQGVSSLLKALQSDTGFKEPPVGPIADYIRLLEPSWSSILERSFGGNLNSFIVTSKQDQNRLRSLMERYKV
jgi:structural maintenance of chromosomes protein 6